MEDLAEGIAIFFIGASALLGVLAVGARIAVKPILESWIRLRQTAAAEEDRLRTDRRLQLLEAELQVMQQRLRTLAEAEEFRRQLEQGPPDPSRATRFLSASE